MLHKVTQRVKCKREWGDMFLKRTLSHMHSAYRRLLYLEQKAKKNVGVWC